MIAWLLLNWRSVLIGAGALTALGLGLYVVHSIKESGRNEVRVEQLSRDKKATDAANASRSAHDLACARGLPECLSDGWTRDR